MNTGHNSNPFSSHLVEPARGGYIFTAENPHRSLHTVMNRLEESRYRGHLVGAHGAGKSTLLTDIQNHLTASGRSVTRWQSNDRNPWIPRNWWRQVSENDVVLIDGGERLYPGLLALVRLVTRTLGRGLIITTHAPVGLGTSISVDPDPLALAVKINALRPGTTEAPDHPTRAQLEEVAQRLKEHNGNGREVLFDLYIQFEKGDADRGKKPSGGFDEF